MKPNDIYCDATRVI